MKIIDSQVHAYAANTPDRPWAGTPNWPTQVTGDEMVAAMNSVGVDGAILISAYSIYGYDASYAVEVRNAHPGRFALVKPIDPADPALAETITDWKGTDGTVGTRILLNREADRGPEDSGIAVTIRESARLGLPVNLLCWGRLDTGIALIDSFPEAFFVLDHMGLLQPHSPPASPEPFAELPKVLDLARRENAVIKISGACTLSHAGYPYPDIWDPLGRIFDAWGIERCLWGTDWTRTTALVSYDRAVDSFRLTDRLTVTERTVLMGGACANVYGWAPEAKSESPRTCLD